MRSSVLLLSALCVFAATAAFGHLCNNIFRTPDRLVVKPERDVITLEKADEFRIFVKNNYPKAIRDVRVTATSETPGLTAQVTPESIATMKPGQKGQFVVKVTAGDATPNGAHRVRIGVGARELGFRPVRPVTTEELQQTVAREKNPSTVVQAAESLASRKDPLGAKVLAEFVGGAKGREYVGRALRSVGIAGDPANAELARGMLSTRDGYLKGNAILALGVLHVDRDRIQSFTRDQDDFVRTCTLAAIAMQKDQSVFPALLSATESTDVFVRVAAGWGLAYNARQEGIDVLDRALNEGDVESKIMAANALVHVASLQQ
jgi:hypothetical protein